MSSPLPASGHRPTVDGVVFMTAFLVVVGICVPLLVWPDASGPAIVAVYDWIAGHFGIFYQWAVLGLAAFLGWIAFGRHGKIMLGNGDERPDFSTFSWISMIFCAGVGAGLIYWATIEWTHYIGNPPFDAKPFSAEARNWATSYGLFHWGPLAWTIYALPTVAISYQYYVRCAKPAAFDGDPRTFAAWCLGAGIGPRARCLVHVVPHGRRWHLDRLGRTHDFRLIC